MARTRWMIAVTAVLVLALGACSQNTSGPTASDYQKQRAEILAKHNRNAATLPGNQQQGAQGAGDGTAADPGAALDDIGAFFYDPVGKRDPFRSFIQDHKSLDDGIDSPLEKFDLGQLEVVGVVWRGNRRRALILDPSGQAYVVAEGDTIGKNAGTILAIQDSTMLVREKYVDFHGDQTEKEIEMRIRQSQGG